MWEWRRIGRHAPPLRTLRTAAALLSALARPASAKTYYVNALCGDDANTGLKPGLAFATLQRAADKAAAGSTILVAPGVYAPLSTAKKLTVKSTAGKAQTAIDGGGAARRATLAAGTQLAGFTLQNGAADYTKKTGKFDLDSGARKVGKVDMGAYELQPQTAVPADFDGDGLADFATYLSNAKAPYFQRLFSSSQFRETRMLPMGSKGDVPVVGVYEAPEPDKRPAAAPAVWTGSAWTYVDRSYADVDLDLLGE